MITVETGVVLRRALSAAGTRAIHLEGGLLGPDILERLEDGALPGQRPADFGIQGGRSVLDETAEIYRDAKDLWKVFRRRLERLPEEDPATSLTREGWAIPFLGLLGYELSVNRRAYDVDGTTFAISHRAGENEDAPPIHIAGARRELGRVDPSGRPRMSPHALMQEFLNRSEHLWGIVTNGRLLRLLRKSTLLRRQAYIQFDLEAIFEAEGDAHFKEFLLLYRLLHRSRLPQGIADAPECFLERYHREALEQGNRARDRLRDGVERSLQILGTGFLRANPGWSPSPAYLYQELLRLVYRLLFLLVGEERGLLGGNDLYREHYSINRLRRLVDRREAYTEHDDLWHSLCVLWHLFREATPVPQAGDQPLASLLGLSVLDGDLFEPISLEKCTIPNRDLLEAFYYLAYYYDDEARTYRRVNYAGLDVEELGSVYESLLDNHPVIVQESDRPAFRFTEGTERKSTGSYYTPPELVQELVKSALEPVLKERLSRAKTVPEKEQAILSIRVLDPACGSGHFLLAAARRLGKELARVRTGEEEPSPEALREAVREVIAHCIYGVDKNPLAVELCRVALWIESHVPGKPLTFLDHRIRCGDSLVGIWDPVVLKEGIPDGAYDPVAGDDKGIARSLKRRNEQERAGQYALSAELLDNRLLQSTLEALDLDKIPDDSLEAIAEKQRRFKSIWRLQSPIRRAANLWTAAFFQELKPGSPGITTDAVRRALAGQQVHGQIAGLTGALAHRLRFFHWPLEFPEAFAEGGFDVVLCNPPWERIKLQEEEFFAIRDPGIARAPNKAERGRRIKALQTTNPALWQEYQNALHDADATSKFLRQSGRFPLTARGDINTYSVFAELFANLLRPAGRAGVVVPTGIATDATNQKFFAHLVESGRLVSLYDFDNRAKLFPAVISLQKFVLLTVRGQAGPKQPAKFAFFCHLPDDLRRHEKILELLPEDFALLNPNTRTCPVFRTRQDAELTKAIYRRVPVLVNERTSGNPWGVRFLRMFDMANDSHLFRTRHELEREGFRLMGNVFVKGHPHSPFAVRYLPLYEAKMIGHYDHRFGTYEGVDRSSTHLPTPTEAPHADPTFVPLPWYWVPAEEVEARLGGWNRGWLLGFRNVARSTDERTAIFSLLPKTGVGHSMPLLFSNASVGAIPCQIGNLSAICFDFCVRQKLGGVNMTYNYVQQFPVLPPSAYTSKELRFIVPRVLELVYTAWDLKPFADDVWADADAALREAITRQWEANQATGGVDPTPPDWLHLCHSPFALRPSPGEGIPLPPFKWNESRRALLRAELDAFYARLYGLTRKQLRYILDPGDLTERELVDILDPWEEVTDPLDPQGYADRVARSTFPGETFRVLKEKELRQFGEYLTRRLVLEAWEALEEPGRVDKHITSRQVQGEEP
ncbi:MAG: Eco57I restriction-modification methylase domain-containing protein [bacterium JZ-2024 1]